MPTTDQQRSTRPASAWAGGLIGILAGLGATIGLLVAEGAGLALGAAFGAAAGVLLAGLITMWSARH